MNGIATSGNRPRIRRLFATFCAFAIGFVAVFHVCGFVSAQSSDLAVVSADLSDGSSPFKAEAGAEKCHLCAVSQLAAVAAAEAPVSQPQRVSASADIRLVEFRTPTSSPPPRSPT